MTKVIMQNSKYKFIRYNQNTYVIEHLDGTQISSHANYAKAYKVWLALEKKGK